MNLLADESIDRQIVDHLRRDEHHVWYVAEMEPEDLGGVVAYGNPPLPGVVRRDRIEEVPQRHHRLFRDEHAAGHVPPLDVPIAGADAQHAHVVATRGDR